MFSIYTFIHSIPSDVIDYKDALDNFCSFAEEVCVSTTQTSKEDKTVQLLQEYQINHPNLKIINVEGLDIASPSGQWKEKALRACTQPFCILFDADERIRLNDKLLWIKYAQALSQSDYDALFIPTIDLYNSEKEYKSLNAKWYLHKNKLNLHRGAPKFAYRQDGSIDISKADSAELIDNYGNLAKTVHLIHPITIENIKRIGITTYHLGWLDKQKRIKSNIFGRKVLDNITQKKNEAFLITKLEEFDDIKYYPHDLKLWYE
jgi:hypothetical protein